jgi:probable HAF family extracellular repeat protein
MKLSSSTKSFRIARIGLALAVFAAPVGAQEHNSQPVRFTVTDLGTLGGTYSQAFLLNNEGFVGGTASLPDGTQHAVLWRNGRIRDLGTLGGPNSIAFGSPNERGQIVGEAETSIPDPNGEDFCGFLALGDPSSGTCQAFFWQDGVMTPLPALGDSRDRKQKNSAANWINNRGAAVGTAENDVTDLTCPGRSISPQVLEFKPVIWEEGQVRELPTFRNEDGDSDPDGVAFAINDRGQVVGASGRCTTFNANSTQTYLVGLHALLWHHGRATDLGNLGGTGPGGGNVAVGINNQGQVVGSSYLSYGTTFHGFLWTEDTGMKDLSTLLGDQLSAALGVNDRGDVVGISLGISPNGSVNPRAFFWRNGTMTDLNTLIPAGSPLLLIQACSINSRGELIGLAVETSSGELHGFLAIPKPSDNDERPTSAE